MSWKDIIKADEYLDIDDNITARGGFRGIRMTLTKPAKDSNYEFVIKNWPNSKHLNYTTPKVHYLANKESVSSIFEELLEELP